MNNSYPFIFILSFLFFSACDHDTSNPDSISDCDDAIAEENFGNFEWIQQHIFTPSCAAAASCHVNTQTMDLREGVAFNELVNVSAKNNAIRVVPGDPENSLLMVTIDHESQGGRFSGELPLIGTMPLGGDILCLEKRQTIEEWIRSLN